MKKHSARVAPLSACNSPVLTLTKVEGDERSHDSPAPVEAQAQSGMEAGGRGSRCCWTCSVMQLKKIFWGVVVVLGVCSSWSGSTQLAKLTFKEFNAPFTLTWFATNWNFLFFPLYYIGHVFKSAEKQTPQQRYSFPGELLEKALVISEKSLLVHNVHTCVPCEICIGFHLLAHFICHMLRVHGHSSSSVYKAKQKRGERKGKEAKLLMEVTEITADTVLNQSKEAEESVAGTEAGNLRFMSRILTTEEGA